MLNARRAFFCVMLHRHVITLGQAGTCKELAKGLPLLVVLMLKFGVHIPELAEVTPMVNSNPWSPLSGVTSPFFLLNGVGIPLSDLILSDMRLSGFHDLVRVKNGLRSKYAIIGQSPSTRGSELDASWVILP